MGEESRSKSVSRSWRYTVLQGSFRGAVPPPISLRPEAHTNSTLGQARCPPTDCWRTGGEAAQPRTQAVTRTPPPPFLTPKYQQSLKLSGKTPRQVERRPKSPSNPLHLPGCMGRKKKINKPQCQRWVSVWKRELLAPISVILLLAQSAPGAERPGWAGA